MNTANTSTVWIFHGENGKFSSGVFTSAEKAEEWIFQNKLSGVLTEYPLDIGVYDWAIKMDLFEAKKGNHYEPKFIQSFTTGSQKHFHFENGEKE